MYRSGIRKLAGAAVVAASLSLVSVAVPATANAAEPAFQLPFPCDQTWHGNSSNSSAHRSYEIDFNRGPKPDSDLGDKVVAAAKGTVRTASNQGSANGFGNLVKIEHSGGYFTYYAHLKTISVSVGQSVTRGQKIGTLGNTSKPGNNITPHLHYEVRLGGSGYPDNIQKATFNGSRFNYPDASITSRNC
ncbi:MAG: M23 family metallopeptidase [Pseudonocardiaceae bacterium]